MVEYHVLGSLCVINSGVLCFVPTVPGRPDPAQHTGQDKAAAIQLEGGTTPRT